jgi:hypothetical protein
MLLLNIRVTTKFGICNEICGFKAKGLVTARNVLSDIRILAVGRARGVEGRGRNECRNL